MANNIVQRMMDSEADANRDISDKSFHHTVDPLASNPSVTFIDQSALSGGQSVHDELLRRAQQKASSEPTASNKPTFRHYRDSLVGAIGQDREVRREVTMRSREERLAREERFGRIDDTTATTNNRSKRGRDRQRFNATGDATADTSGSRGRQAFNTESGMQAQPKASFREPPSRGYNPFQ